MPKTFLVLTGNTRMNDSGRTKNSYAPRNELDQFDLTPPVVAGRNPMQTVLPIMIAMAFFAATLTSAQEATKADIECITFPYDQASSLNQHRIQELVQWIRQALGSKSELLRALDEVRPEICLSESIFGAEGYFDMDEDRIVLKSSLPQGMMQAVALHELRHVHQARTGTCPNSTMSMREAARVTLALEADASAVSLAVAWGLKKAGDPRTWDAFAAWSTHADLADEFEKEIALGGDTVRATARAFAMWYASDWRREAYYLSACSEYLDRQDATHAIPMYGMAPADLLDRLCRLPNGEPYPCEEPVKNDR